MMERMPTLGGGTGMSRAPYLGKTSAGNREAPAFGFNSSFSQLPVNQQYNKDGSIKNTRPSEEGN